MPRIIVAVTDRDGEPQLVNIGRPAALVAFADKYGKNVPEAYPEVAWLTHRALSIDTPLDEWLETLEDLTANDAEVERVDRELAGRQTPLEQLAKLSGEATLELVDAVVASIGEAGLRPEDEPKLPQLVVDARAELEERTQAALEQAEADAELERQAAQAPAAEPVPTMPAPVTSGGGE